MQSIGKDWPIRYANVYIDLGEDNIVGEERLQHSVLDHASALDYQSACKHALFIHLQALTLAPMVHAIHP